MQKRNEKTLFLVEAALIAALYVALNYAQELLIPSSTSGMVQIRLSEVLTVLAVFMPSAIPGLGIGCLLSNLITVGVMPLDTLLGTGATLLAGIFAYALRNIKAFKVPFLSMLMPVILNGVIIGLELELFYIEGDFELVGFFGEFGLVAAGEFVACVVLGIPFYLMLKRTPLGGAFLK